MTTIVFEDGDWTIMSSSWTAGSEEPGQTLLCYTWGASIGWTPSSTGSARLALPIDMETFLGLIARGGPVVDLRDHLKPSG